MSVNELIAILQGSPDRDMEVRLHDANKTGDSVDIEFVTIMSSGEVWIEGIMGE